LPLYSSKAAFVNDFVCVYPISSNLARIAKRSRDREPI